MGEFRVSDDWEAQVSDNGGRAEDVEKGGGRLWVRWNGGLVGDTVVGWGELLFQLTAA